jgi:hypothetical protein
MTIYLYVKTHNKTGLKYLGKTVQDPFTYLGSGYDWTDHLKEFGRSHSTEVIQECSNNKELSYWGRYYSKLWRVTTSVDDFGNRIWANRIPETGGGVKAKGHSAWNKGLDKTDPRVAKYSTTAAISNKGRAGQNKGKTLKTKGLTYEEIYGADTAIKLKQMRSVKAKGKNNSHKNNPRFDNNEYKFYNSKSGEILYCTRWVFYNTLNVGDNVVSNLVKHGAQWKGWQVLYS